MLPWNPLAGSFVGLGSLGFQVHQDVWAKQSPQAVMQSRSSTIGVFSGSTSPRGTPRQEALCQKCIQSIQTWPVP